MISFELGVTEYLVDAFLKVKVGEITREKLVFEGPNSYLAVHWKGVTLKARRLCVAGLIGEIQSRGKFVDLTLREGDATVPVRIWEEKSGLLEQAGLAKDEPLKVLGVLRVFRETAYISPIILRRVTLDYLAYFQRRIEEERDRIVEHVLKIARG